MILEFEQNNIDKLVRRMSYDKKAVVELSKYNHASVVDFCLKNKYYTELVNLFRPYEIDGVTKRYFEIIDDKINMLSIINNAFSTVEESYTNYSFLNKPLNGVDYANFMEGKYIIPDNIKKSIISRITRFNLDDYKDILVADTYPKTYIKDGDVTKIKLITESSIPLISPCLNLYDKNIEVTYSNVDKDSKVCELGVSLRSLSSKNINELESIRGRINKGSIIFSIPYDDGSKVGDIDNKFNEMFSLVEEQDITFGSFPLKDLYNHCIQEISSNPSLKNYLLSMHMFATDYVVEYMNHIESNHLVYDGMVYLNHEYLEKHQEFEKQIQKTK